MKRCSYIFLLLTLVSLNLNAQIYINELMPSNDSVIFDNYGEDDDWIEIYNAGNSAVDLQNYYISDDPLLPLKWQISGSVNIYSGDYTLIWADKDIIQGPEHVDFKLGSSGETIVLTAPDAITVIDTYSYPTIGENKSYGRITDAGATSGIFDISTPLASNANGLLKVNQPVLIPEGGLYSGSQTVSITTSTLGATIYYTLDGSEPTENSMAYTGPISITTTETIRAKAFKSSYASSAISTESYTLNFTSTLPIIHLSTAPENLWDDMNGIYTIGSNGLTGYCIADSANFNQDWERLAYVEMFNPDGSKSLDHDIGLKISSNCSRKSPQKPVAMYFRNEYGVNGDNEVNEKLFHNKEIDYFKRLYLRKGNGTDFTGYSRLYADVVTNLLTEGEMDMETSGSKMTELFINNQYWGIYDLREKFDQHRFEYQYKYALDRDSIDIIRNPGRPVTTAIWATERATHGTMDDYYDFLNDFMTLDLTVEANYDIVAEQIQMDEMINWLSSGVFLCNRDWIVNNVKYWKYGENGKWRWCFTDFDHTLRIDQLNYDVLTSRIFYGLGGIYEETNRLYQKLFENPRFRDEFIQRTATYMNLTWTNNRLDPIVDSLQAVWAPQIARAHARWDGDSNHSTVVAMPDTYNSMDSVLNTFKAFMAQRPPYVKQHFMNRWGMSGMYDLTINTTAASNGHVAANNILKELPHQYVGEYFNDIPLKLLAVANPGYRFSHWQETGITDAYTEVNYNSNQTLTPIFIADVEIVINEIHYHPELNDGDEFIELYNPSSFTKDMTGYKFEGICFDFPKGFEIQPGEYIIIANDSTLYEGNGYVVRDWKYTGLSNGGESIKLINPIGLVADSVLFDDTTPWPLEADGSGYSLALLNPSLDNVLAASWQIQPSNVKVTPGAMNIFCTDLSYTEIINQPDCPGINDGSITLNVANGLAPLSYIWSHGPLGSSITGLAPATYICTITDGLGCETMDTTVIQTPQTPASINLNLVTITNNYVITNWSSIPNNLNYYLQYREVGASSWNNYSTSSTAAIISNLTTCTDYEIRIGGDCSADGISNFNPIQTFTTSGCFVCTAPVGLYQFNIQNISAIITWDVLVGATNYTYKFRKVGDPNWISQTTTFPIAVLFGISGCTDYEWTMETTCYDGSTAQSSTINNFSTVCKGAENTADSLIRDKIEIYPNPAQNILHVKLDCTSDGQLFILNELGQVQEILNPKSENIKIDVSNYPKGVYYLIDKMQSHRFVII